MAERLWVAGLLAGLLFSSAKGTEVRLSGMGDLRLVVRDETNPVTLFRFGGNPAGLVRDETTSTYKLDVSYAGRTSSTMGRTDSVDYRVFGDVLPPSLRSFLPSASSISHATGMNEVEGLPDLGLVYIWSSEGGPGMQVGFPLVNVTYHFK